MSGSSQPSRRGKNKNAGNLADDSDELTKQEIQIARYLRLSCAKKQGNLLGMKVDFFVGQKLVDALLESKWGPKGSTSPVLADRKACVLFMQRLMNKQLFYRAIKVYKDSDVKDKSNETDATPSKRKTRKSAAQQQQQQTPSATPKPGEETPKTNELAKSTTTTTAEVKRKFKLEMADDQKFEDSNEPYVWVYDPTSTKTYIIGSLLILGAIGICLFPLWPSQVREGVYYLSLAGASFLGAILGLAVLKYIVFGVVWAATFGSVHFWLLPNLTEDVGFFESFVPIYKVDSAKSKAAKNTTTTSIETNKKDDDAATTTSKSEQLLQQSSVLSGSTVEITSGDLAMDKSSVVRRRKSSASNNIREEDGFELVDDDDARTTNK